MLIFDFLIHRTLVLRVGDTHAPIAQGCIATLTITTCNDNTDVVDLITDNSGQYWTRPAGVEYIDNLK